MISRHRPRVLLIAEQCNPDWSSVPLEGYKYFQSIQALADVTLVTHIRNRPALERVTAPDQVVYIPEGWTSRHYYPWVERIAAQGKVNWPLYHVLSYPIYAEFNRKVDQQFADSIRAGDYDLVHAITPMMPRYPVKVVRACQKTPFLLGPVNGGVPFPSGFRETAKQEFAQLNWLRAVGRWLLPGYVQTYRQAHRVLAGSTYTLELLQGMFDLTSDRLSLFYENGIDAAFLAPVQRPANPARVNLLFVGRLVPYKGADMVIEAIALLPPEIRAIVHLTLVGDGSERMALEQRVQSLHLSDQVTFAGWVQQQETVEYYRRADIFCFPSVREFGGAVVLEAMACGLPCIVVNNGGIGEYVTAATGFKLEPTNRTGVIQALAEKLQILVGDPQLRQQMSGQAIARAREFTWKHKAQQLLAIYQQLLD